VRARARANHEDDDGHVRGGGERVQLEARARQREERDVHRRHHAVQRCLQLLAVRLHPQRSEDATPYGFASPLDAPP
jgi:hypothetical protein